MKRDKRLAAAAVVGMSGLAAIGFAATTGGCSSLDEARIVQQDLERLRTDLDHRAEQLAATAAAIGPDDPDRPQAEALASMARTRAQAVGVGLGHLESVLSESESPSDPITQAVSSISVLLPQPLRLPAVLAAAAGTLAWRSSRLKGGLRSVALSIEAAKRTDEEFRRCFARHVEMFKAAQTPVAQKLVRAATHPSPAV